jgi:hypothetical protein
MQLCDDRSCDLEGGCDKKSTVTKQFPATHKGTAPPYTYTMEQQFKADLHQLKTEFAL